MTFIAWFGLVALAEMATFFWVGSWIGLGWALGLAVATALIGSMLVRVAGLAVLGRLRQRLTLGELPGRELADGAAILVSGAFLISPGFITDLLGFLLLVPPVRGLLYETLRRRFSTRMTVISEGRYRYTREAGPGEVIDVEQPD